MRNTTLLLLLPILATFALAIPSPKNPRTNSERIHAERAGAAYPGVTSSANSTATAAPLASTSSFTGIPAASSSASVADSLSPYAASSSNSTTSSSNSTGLDTVNPNPGNVSSETLSSLLAKTTAYQSFTFTDYVAASTTSSAASAVVTGGSNGNGGDEESNGSDDEDEDAGTSSSSSGPNGAAVQAAQGYADSMIGSLLPTLTLEVVLEPTQVRQIPTYFAG